MVWFFGHDGAREKYSRDWRSKLTACGNWKLVLTTVNDDITKGKWPEAQIQTVLEATTKMLKLKFKVKGSTLTSLLKTCLHCKHPKTDKIMCLKVYDLQRNFNV